MIDFDRYANLIGFGDSLVDSGNAGNVFPLPPSEGYFEERFSNGPNYFDLIFAEITGQVPGAYTGSFDALIGFEADDNNGVNFALGSATVLEADIAPPFPLPQRDLADQIDQYIDADRLVFPDGVGEDTLFAINMGGNDFLDLFGNSPDVPQAQIDAVIDEIVAVFSQEIGDLANAGARSVLVAGIPNVGAAPDTVSDFGTDLASALAAVEPATTAVNTALRDTLDDFAANRPSVDVFFFSPNFDEAVAAPESFGLDAALLSTPFVDDLEAGRATLADIDRYAFIDDVHPTAAIHREFFEQASAAEQLGGLSVDVGNEASVTLYELYDIVLGRRPDRSGFGFWDDIAATALGLDTIADLFAGSGEARGIFGPGVSNTEFVSEIYLNAFERQADVAGAAFWSGLIDDGSIDRGDVALFFARSDEADVIVNGAVDDGLLIPV